MSQLTEQDNQATSVRWRIVALLLAYSFLSWFNRVSMAVAYDEQIRHEYAISEEQIGNVYSALLFAYMIAMVFLLFRPQGLFGERIIERV